VYRTARDDTEHNRSRSQVRDGGGQRLATHHDLYASRFVIVHRDRDLDRAQ
jgi:hypothetical protein